MASKKWQFHLVKVLALALVAAGATSQSALAQQQNPVQYENTNYPGDPGWQIRPQYVAKGPDIEGYGSAASVSSISGTATISFYVSTIFQSVDLDIYRMGWYGGAGGRHMLGPIPVQAVNRGPCPVMAYTVTTTGGKINTYTMTICDWALSGQGSHTLTVPQTWLSGVYLVKLSGFNGTTLMEQSYIPFVVTDGRTPKILFQHSVMTDVAYNAYGDGSLYTVDHPKVSFSRPFANGNWTGSWNYSAGNFFRWEYHMIRFLEGEGGSAYDVGYFTDLDLHANGLPPGIKGLISVGHDEYWTLQMRQTVQAALGNSGLNLGFFSADDADWNTRLEANPVNPNPFDTMVCFRQADLDPWYQDGVHDQHQVTVRFRNAPVSMPQNQMIGIQYTAIIHGPWDLGPFVTPRQPAWLFQGVDPGTTALNNLMGYETDAVPLSSATIVAISHANGCNGGNCGYTTVYQPNPGLNPTVFAAGTMEWSWGLDNKEVTDFEEGLPSINPPTRAATPIMTQNIFAQFCGPQACH